MSFLIASRKPKHNSLDIAMIICAGMDKLPLPKIVYMWRMGSRQQLTRTSTVVGEPHERASV